MSTTPSEVSAARVVRELGLCAYITPAVPCASVCILPIGHDHGVHEPISIELAARVSRLAEMLWGDGPYTLHAYRATYVAREGGQRDGWRVAVEGTDWDGYGQTKDDAARDCESALARRLHSGDPQERQTSEPLDVLMPAALERVRAEARAEAFEAAAQRCEMIDDQMSPRFCATEIRKLARRPA